METTISESTKRFSQVKARGLAERWHRTGGGNALRAAVMGGNDGLVSNLSLVMGVSGAELSRENILVTGIAGLIAGAFSMALGEWLSVQSTRELYERQMAIEKREIREQPEEEHRELVQIYQAKGLHDNEARYLADQLMKDKDAVLDIMAREELGINPESLGGSPWVAALTSFSLFAIGAIIPVLPFIFFLAENAIIASLVISAIALFVIGSVISLVTSRHFLYAGIRHLLFGLVAALVTFGIGRLIGVSLAG